MGRDSISAITGDEAGFHLLLALGPARAGTADITVDLRSRVEVFKGTGDWREVHMTQSLPVQKTAVLICDMWDRHWCSGATGRVNGLVKLMAPFLEAGRKRGIQIIHAPSETMDFYRDVPQRKRMLALAKVDPPTPLILPDPPLPIDDKSGSDTPDHLQSLDARDRDYHRRVRT